VTGTIWSRLRGEFMVRLTSKTGKSAGLRIGVQSRGERRITAQPKPSGKH
jgi:hypothetical protein